MSWTLLLGLVFALGFTLLALKARRAELERMESRLQERDRAVRQGSDKAQLQHPVVDLSRCLGCGTCVDACPEQGVLELVHGQAMVVNGSHCVGHATCEAECPVGAITVTLADLEERTDIPVLTEGLEAVDSPGLFLAGEVTAHALIKTAIDHGVAVGNEVAKRVRRREPGNGSDVLDLCIVGAGPAGIACSLEAKRHGLRFMTIDQESTLGGTVAKYPRRKLVLTQPVDMPLHGRIERSTFTKEELIGLWRDIAVEHELPLYGGEVFEGLERNADGTYVVRTQARTYSARYVCLAMGRRGTPVQLGVPGEDLQKVAYSLMDAHSFEGRRVLVVGGGDSAVETAMGLAEQPGNKVTISYRKESFFRVRERNRARLDACVAQGKLQVLYKSEVLSIQPDAVELSVQNGAGPKRVMVPNDDVFVMAGGVPPFERLAESGVSFDPSRRPKPPPIVEVGTGLMRALTVGFLLSLVALFWAVWNGDYYLLAEDLRPTHEKHEFLRPTLGLGLGLGITASVLILVNLLYLLRRSPRIGFTFGSLQTWMTSHIVTGILALLCALLHGAMTPRDTVGGQAFWALTVLLMTGAIGRYLYAYVPRAANGRELALGDVRARLGLMSEEWDQGQRKFREQARNDVLGLIEQKQWRSTLPSRLLALFGGQRDLHRVLVRLKQSGRDEGVPDDQIRETLQLARAAHRTALMAAHYEDLRGLLNGWRYLHRWVAALMVILVAMHIYYSLTYGEF